MLKNVLHIVLGIIKLISRSKPYLIIKHLFNKYSLILVVIFHLLLL